MLKGSQPPLLPAQPPQAHEAQRGTMPGLHPGCGWYTGGLGHEADGAVRYDLRGFSFPKKQRKGADSSHNQPPSCLISFSYLHRPRSCRGTAYLGEASEVPQAPPSGHHQPGNYLTLGTVDDSRAPSPPTCPAPRPQPSLFSVTCSVASAKLVRHKTQTSLRRSGCLLVSPSGQLSDVGVEGHVLHGRFEMV